MKDSVAVFRPRGRWGRVAMLSLRFLLVVSAAQPLYAHHSLAAEFNTKQIVTLSGTVTRLEWTNPHVWVYMDVKDDRGTPQHWQCEGGAPNALIRNGWNKDSVTANDEIIIEGLLAKDGSKTCNARMITLPDGRSVSAHGG